MLQLHEKLLHIKSIQELEGCASLAQIIRMKLQKSLKRGDIVPSMVSRVVWQTQGEIAKKWIETYAPAEHERFVQTSGEEPIIDELRQRSFKIFVDSVGLTVEAILSCQPSFAQRYTSRLGLMARNIQDLSIEDQDRLSALSLGIPHPVWCAFVRILANFEGIRNFYQDPGTTIKSTGGGLTLSNVKKKGDPLIFVPTVPGGIIQTEKSEYITVGKDLTCQVDFGGGIDQTVTFDSAAVNNANSYLMDPKSENLARKILHGRHDITAWKNRFGHKGDPKKEEPEPSGALAWQR